MLLLINESTLKRKPKIARNGTVLTKRRTNADSEALMPLLCGASSGQVNAVRLVGPIDEQECQGLYRLRNHMDLLCPLCGASEGSFRW